jgi:hypothetical protein
MQTVIIDEPVIDPSAADQASGRHDPDARFLKDDRWAVLGLEGRYREPSAATLRRRLRALPSSF